MATTTPKPSRQLVTVSEKTKTVRSLFLAHKDQIQAALPRHLTVDRMLRLVMTALTRQPRLLDCTQASLYSAVIQCAQLGLEPDLMGQAYLVPFRNTQKSVVECQLIPGYLGLLALARRSGEVASVEARVVYEGDAFEYRHGLREMLDHVPAHRESGKDLPPITHVYAIAHFKQPDLKPSWEVLQRWQVEDHRKRSKAAQDGPWVTDWPAMAKKTVLRVLCKLLPSSVELRTAVALDEAADAGLPQGLPDLTVLPAEPAAAAAAGPTDPPPPVTGPDCGCPDAPNGVHVPECPHAGGA